MKGTPQTMTKRPDSDDVSPRPSRVIAEALVQRQSPGQIAERASALGFPRSLTRAIMFACASVAAEGSASGKSAQAAAAH
jgi:hypothetical protein